MVAGLAEAVAERLDVRSEQMGSPPVTTAWRAGKAEKAFKDRIDGKRFAGAFPQDGT